MTTRYLRRLPLPSGILLILLIVSVTLTMGSSQLRALAAVKQASTLAVGDLRVDYLVNPLGIDDMKPQLSWELTSSAQNQSQQAYEVQVATSTALLAANTPDLWDSGKVTSSASINVVYNGTAPHSREHVYWRVQVWDTSGNPSAWSSTAQWEMGLLDSSDWLAHWISNPSSSTLPLFAKQFTLTNSIKSARLYITGLGIYDARINGQAISKDVLQPPDTDYLKRVIYSTYDVTSLLQQGANTLGVQLGNGMANVPVTPGRYEKFTGTKSTPRMLAQLEVKYSDNTTARIVSDSSWLTTSGPTTFSTWYGGEDYDARLNPVGWLNPGANLSSWHAATVTTAPSSQTILSAQMVPAVQIVGTLHPVKITQPAAGVYIFDFGINFTGWEELRVQGARGTKVTMTPGELLKSNGTISQATVIAPFYETYTLSGSGTEVWHPDFDFHGFRYVQVTGLPAAPSTSTLTGLQINTANDSAGAFTSGNSLLNSIHKIINQAIQNNMGSLLSDCPDREKLGWLEQDHLEFGSVSRAYNVAAYYREFFRNMSDDQLSNGLVPDNVPEYAVFGGGFRDDPNWGSMIIQGAWELYQTYGDTETLSTYYSNMQRYLAYLQSKSSGNLLSYGLGDWGTLDKSTPVGVVATYPYYLDAVEMSKIATLLGHTSDATTYSTLAKNIASAFNTKYLAASHTMYANGTEAADAFALDMGVVPSQYQAAVVQHLVNTIQANGNHVNVGEIALPAVFRALANGGRSDVVYTVATQTSYPSYGYEVVHGATSLLEFWNGSNGTNSQDHFMLGALNEWLSFEAGGLQPASDAVAYNKLVFRPAVVGSLTQASSTYNTPYGVASSAWTRSGSTVQLTVQVPVNTIAMVMMPLKSGYKTYSVGSGSYTFTSSLS